MQEKVWLQPIVQFLSVRDLWKPRSLRFILNTWVRRGKIREDAHVTLTVSQGVSTILPCSQYTEKCVLKI